LVRRGVRHGTFRPTCPPSTAEDAASRFADDRPIYLPGALRVAGDARLRTQIASTQRLFANARAGGGLGAFVARRLKGSRAFRVSGATVEMFDPREIEKVYADEIRAGRSVARDLYAKLSWISTDEQDRSLRIRFSFGSEMLGEWHRDPRRAEAADRYAAAVFPEGRAITGAAPLLRTLTRLFGRRLRFSERIVYANAPGGGAVFHHDAEPTQLGVLYGQLAGRTAWLALPKTELAEHLAATGARGALGKRLATKARALRALDDADDDALGRLLNESPTFTRRLVAAGALIVLAPGDALVLPSHAFDRCCWHAVFAPGRTASLAHSYGVFAARR
jgi:hypothetical protein